MTKASQRALELSCPQLRFQRRKRALSLLPGPFCHTILHPPGRRFSLSTYQTLLMAFFPMLILYFPLLAVCSPPIMSTNASPCQQLQPLGTSCWARRIKKDKKPDWLLLKHHLVQNLCAIRSCILNTDGNGVQALFSVPFSLEKKEASGSCANKIFPMQNWDHNPSYCKNSCDVVRKKCSIQRITGNSTCINHIFLLAFFLSVWAMPS